MTALGVPPAPCVGGTAAADASCGCHRSNRYRLTELARDIQLSVLKVMG
jgi:hypothetical protein